MAGRLLIASQLSTGPNPTDLSAVTWTTLDDTNGSKIQLTGRELLLFRGTGTVTLVSTPDGSGRTRDIEKVLSNDDDPVFAGPFGLLGWRQIDGPWLYIDSVATALHVLEVAVLTIL